MDFMGARAGGKKERLVVGAPTPTLRTVASSSILRRFGLDVVYPNSNQECPFGHNSAFPSFDLQFKLQLTEV